MFVKLGVKRSLDLIAAVGGVLLLLPLFVLIGLAIKFDSPGSIFFRQERMGRGGRRFRIHKFRTMVEDSEKHGPQVTAGGDARITKIGALLRRTKLDELPQLLDVIAGNMSLVGPRPEVPRYVDIQEPVWLCVLKMRPGITGPTQVSFRNEEAMIPPGVDVDIFYRQVLLPQKLRKDCEYVNTWTLGGDVVLIMRTIVGF